MSGVFGLSPTFAPNLPQDSILGVPVLGDERQGVQQQFGFNQRGEDASLPGLDIFNRPLGSTQQGRGLFDDIGRGFAAAGPTGALQTAAGNIFGGGKKSETQFREKFVGNPFEQLAHCRPPALQQMASFLHNSRQQQ